MTARLVDEHSREPLGVYEIGYMLEAGIGAGDLGMSPTPGRLWVREAERDVQVHGEPHGIGGGASGPFGGFASPDSEHLRYYIARRIDLRRNITPEERAAMVRICPRDILEILGMSQ